MSLVFPTLTPEVQALLARAMFPEPARIAEALAAYQSEPDRRLCGWETDGQLRSAAGLRMRDTQAEVVHLGTHPDIQGRGHARDLLHAVMTTLNLTLLWAETDDDSVGFYRRAGFEVEPVPSRWPGARYRCTRTAAQRPGGGLTP